MKSAVIVFPGINRERDMARALRAGIGHRKPAMVWHADSELPAGTDLVVLPGGFSYGDYLRCGAIAARAPIMEAVRAHAAKGGLVLGDLQRLPDLCEAGLLPGVLMRNAQLQFICRDGVSAGRALRHAFTRGYNAGPGDPRAGRAWRRQLHRRRRDARAARGRRPGAVPLCAPDGKVDPNWNSTARSTPSPASSREAAMCSADAASGKPRRCRARRHRRPRPVRRAASRHFDATAVMTCSRTTADHPANSSPRMG